MLCSFHRLLTNSGKTFADGVFDADHPIPKHALKPGSAVPF
jgi:hypothetical protein